MAAGSAVLSVSGLVKKFGHVKALDGAALDLRAGELLLLLGPNGAGKTTLTRILTTLSRAGRGDLLFRGEKLSDRGRLTLRREIGYLSHQTFLYAHLSAVENLEFFGGLYGVENLPGRIREALAQTGLAGIDDRPAGTFSRGMQQRLSLARVLLPDPSLLILDEPYTGLDPAGSRDLTQLLSGLKSRERAILLVTHQIEDCLPIADRIAILFKGRVVWEGSGASLETSEVRIRYFAAIGEAP